MEKYYKVIKIDSGLIAIPSNCNIMYTKKLYPEMFVIDFKTTKEQIKEKYSNKVRFENMDEV